MRNVILKYGLIAGGIVSVVLLLGTALWIDEGMSSFEYGELIGYASMVLALSLVFFGIKSYRDNYHNGAMSFGMGFQVGILITLIASFMYAGTWEGYYQSKPELRATFMDKYTEQYLNKMRQQGASEVEIQKQAETMAVWKERYKNPLLRFGMTLVEILPVGIIITLISAAVLRRREASAQRSGRFNESVITKPQRFCSAESFH